MVEINAGIDEKEPIKNPVMSSICYEQLEINEVSYNLFLHRVSALIETKNQNLPENLI